jgi:hypothetical protein
LGFQKLPHGETFQVTKVNQATPLKRLFEGPLGHDEYILAKVPQIDSYTLILGWFKQEPVCDGRGLMLNLFNYIL